MIFLLSIFGFIFIPSTAFAWGPITHVYLGSEIFSYAPLIPANIMTILRQCRQDFIYGNLMADMILGKKYMLNEKNSHSWETGLKLLRQAKKTSEKAFVYGYLSHLASDTVAHEVLTEDKHDIVHTWIELKADSIINKYYWLQSVTISRNVQLRNDRFLEGSLDSFIFSFNTNKRIYKSMVALSIFNKKRERGMDKNYISELHNESIARIIDFFQNGENSSVMKKKPL